jgi:hypothetical protein
MKSDSDEWGRYQDRQRERLARLFETQGKCEHGYRPGCCEDCLKERNGENGN